MSTSIRFTIPEAAVRKGRPGFTNRSYCFATENTAEFENHVKDTCIKTCHDRRPDFRGHIAVDITAFYPRPEIQPKKKHRFFKRTGKPIKKPDLNTIADMIIAALKNVAWQEDHQVICLIMRKKYAAVACVAVGVHYIE